MLQISYSKQNGDRQGKLSLWAPFWSQQLHGSSCSFDKGHSGALSNPWFLGPFFSHGRAPCGFSSIGKAKWDHCLKKQGCKHHAISLLLLCLYPSIMFAWRPENNWLKLLLTFSLLSKFDKYVAPNNMHYKWLESNKQFCLDMQSVVLLPSLRGKLQSSKTLLPFL